MSVTTSWKTEPLREVVTFDRAVISPQQAGARQYVGLEDVQPDGSLSWKEDQRLPVSDKFAFDRGHILYGKLRPYLRKVARPAFDGMCSTDILPLRPKGNVSRDYLYHYLRTEEFAQQATARSAGVNLPRISPSVLAEFPVALPTTLSEQCRIAAILDKADAIRTRRRAALADADALARALHDEALQNARQDGSLVELPLGKACHIVSGSTLPIGLPFDGQQGGYLMLKVAELNGTGASKSIETAREWTAGPVAPSQSVPANAILFPKRGGAIATNKKRVTSRSAVLDPNLMGVYSRDDRVTASFLIDWFERLDLASISNGSTIPQINKKDLEPLVLEVPVGRHAIRYEELRLRGMGLMAQCEAALADADALYASLATRAFRGEL